LEYRANIFANPSVADTGMAAMERGVLDAMSNNRVN
jgi:hypothetical protein